MSYYWLLCLAICLVESSTQGALYEAKLEFSPNPFKPLIDETLVVLCRLEKKVSIEARQFKSVNSITIKKGKIEVAKLTSDQTEVEVDNDFSGATGSGKLDIGSTVYMQVDVRNPKKTLKGSYTCEVEGDDDNGDSVTATDAYSVDSADASLSEIIEKLQMAEEDIKDNKKEIEDHKKEIEDHKKEIEDNKKEIEDHKKEIEDHKKEIEDNKKEIEDHKKDIEDHKGEIRDLKAKNVELTKQIEDNDEDIKELNTYKSKQVSFTAVMSGRKSAYVSDNTDLVFNEALVNIGGGYNTNTGVFTCPVAGTYYIRYDLQVLNGPKQSAVVLHLNGFPGAVISSYTKDVGVMGAGLVIQLKQGDKLNVRTLRDSRFYYYYAGYSCMFSGYLIK